jgi:tRNA-specific 2-thiouridylase
MDPASHVLIAVSGGVDSTAAMLLLLRQGYRVTALHMLLQDQSGLAEEGLPRICRKLEVPLVIADYHQAFRQTIIDNFARQYLSGRTPNPCTQCNKEIKWHFLTEKARELQADYIATGHYATIRYNSTLQRHEILRRPDQAKDQSYMLWRLDQGDLARTLFPLGDKRKSDIISLVQQSGLMHSPPPESQDICFVPEGNYKKFLTKNNYVREQKGNILDAEGKIIGEHSGIWNYTIGQRRGLGIAAPEPLYVTEIRPQSNEIVVGQRQNLFVDSLQISGVNYIKYPKLDHKLKVSAKTRYRQNDTEAWLIPTESGVRVDFVEPVSAVTPGQSFVAYEQNSLVLGGIIESSRS